MALKRGLWLNRNWRLLWTGQAVSLVGDMMFYTTVLLWIATDIAKGKPWAPAAASGALIATSVPVLVIGPIAGVFVDRWDRRRVMLTADAARYALITCLLLIPALGHHLPVAAQLIILYAVLAVCSAFAEFFDPSRLAILGAIVPADDQAKASGQLQAAFSMSLIIGPPIAAPLLFGVGVQWALILNAASFAFSFGCVHRIQMPDAAEEAAPERAGFFSEFRAGLRFFAANRILVAVAAAIVIAMLGNGAVNALVVFFVPRNLHVAASWLGVLMGAEGAGSIAGALLSGRIATRVQPTRQFWLGLVAAGITVVALSRVTALAPATVIIAVTGLFMGMVSTAVSPILLSTTPSRMLGRVSAVLSPLQQLARIVSMVLAGVLTSTALRNLHATVAGVSFGPYDTVFAVCGLLFTAAGVACIRPMAETAAEAEVATAG